MIRRWIYCALVGSAVGFGVYTVRGFFPAHAVLIGVASAALTYSIFRATDNLRGSIGTDTARKTSPRHQEHTRDRQ